MRKRTLVTTMIALVAVVLLAVAPSVAAKWSKPGNEVQYSNVQPAIEDGGETVDRFEVGRLVLGERNCTATLITELHFLTSAQCIDYGSHYAGVPGVDSLFMDTQDGGSARFQVERIISQGQIAGDVAVGLLASPVPSSVAKPAAISGQLTLVKATTEDYGVCYRAVAQGWQPVLVSPQPLAQVGDGLVWCSW